jgi:hypothetical protein
VSRRDYRDDAIEQLADENAALLRRVREAEAALESWQLLAVAAIHYSHALHVEGGRLVARSAYQREEIRQLIGAPREQAEADADGADLERAA